MTSSRNYSMVRVNKSLLSQLHKERISKGLFSVGEGVSYKTVLSRYVNFELENLCLRIHSEDYRFNYFNRMVKKLAVDTEGILSAIDKGTLKLAVGNDVVKMMTSPEKMKYCIVEEYDTYDYHQPYRRTYYKIDEYKLLYERMSTTRFESNLLRGLHYEVMTVNELYSQLCGRDDFDDIMVALYNIEDASMIFSNEEEDRKQ